MPIRGELLQIEKTFGIHSVFFPAKGLRQDEKVAITRPNCEFLRLDIGRYHTRSVHNAPKQDFDRFLAGPVALTRPAMLCVILICKS